MSMLELFDKGGPVVWILLGYSVMALAIVLERYLHFLRMGRLGAEFGLHLEQALVNRDITGFTNGKRGPEVAVIKGIFQASEAGVQDLVRVATRIGSNELQRMERGFRTLGLLGDTAPLLGLLGTITGMIKAFMVIDQAGGKVDAQALAGGIWEAMITTGVGLAVSIPVLFLLHWLEGQAASRSHAMQHYASLMIESTPHRENTAVKDVHYREDRAYAV